MSNEEIRALRDEAEAAGDRAQVAICNQALDYTTSDGSRDRARAICAEVIADAQAQGEEEE